MGTDNSLCHLYTTIKIIRYFISYGMKNIEKRIEPPFTQLYNSPHYHLRFQPKD